jgi:hypothetical protein
MDTRPRSSLVISNIHFVGLNTYLSQEMDLMGLEDNADFWDMELDDEGEENIPIKDLTKQPSSLGIGSTVLFLLLIVYSQEMMLQKQRKRTSRSLPTALYQQFSTFSIAGLLSLRNFQMGIISESERFDR